MTAIRSVLVPPPQPLTVPLLLALMLHGCGGGVIVGASYLDLFPARKPPLDISQSIEVTWTELPKAENMPTRATKAPAPTGEVAAKEPPEPPPIRESDLKYETPQAEPKQGAPDRTTDREAALRRLKMEEALRDATEGPKDRTASDPNSTSTEHFSAAGAGVRADPELVRYKSSVEKLFRDSFHPAPAIVRANPDIVAWYHVDFDPDTGRILGFKAYKPSGNLAYDSSVEYAIQSVREVPLPPAKYRDLVGSRFTIDFPPP